MKCNKRSVILLCLMTSVFAGCQRDANSSGDGSPAVSSEEPGLRSEEESVQGDVEEVATKIREQIPRATAMTLQDMKQIMALRERIRKDGGVASPMEIERACNNKSLTLILYTLRPEEPPRFKLEFELLTGYFGASRAMGEELQRTAQIGATDVTPGTMTLVADDRITDVTSTVDGDTATGTVSFEMPDVYRGRAEYVAHKVGDEWQIDEFLLPAYRVHLYRDKAGMWRKRNDQ